MDHFVTTAILRDFSSNNSDNKWEISGDKVKFLTFLFYANGDCKDNEGYVSIIFPQDRKYKDFFLSHDEEFRFHVSVVDVAGKKRFTQSIVINPMELVDETDIFQLGLERYLKRETLLNDPAELLPDDCLTICVDVELKHFDILEWVSSLSTKNREIEKTICINGNETYIQLDSDFGRELCRVSKYFRCASDVPMMESSARMVRIPEEERIHFSIIIDISKFEPLPLSIKHICELYRVAEKYDIQPVIETCREFVNALLLTTDDPKVREQAAESVPAILKLAEDYRDDDLKDSVQTYLDSKENFVTNYDALGKHLKEKLHTEWTCKFIEHSFCCMYMRRRVIEPEFKFYQ